MIIPFGRNKGKDTNAVDDNYLRWLTDADNLNVLCGNPWDGPKFKVRGELEAAAREELVRRGYRRIGMRWER